MVDAHTHVWATWPYPPGVPDPVSRGSAENLLHEMDAAGVDPAVVVSAAIDGAAGNNDYGAEVVAPPRPALPVRRRRQPVRAGLPPAGGGGPPPRGVRAVSPVGVSHYLAAENDGWLGPPRGTPSSRRPGRRGRREPGRPAGWVAAIRTAARRRPGVTILLNHLGLVMLHPGGLEAATPAGVGARPAQPRRQGLRLVLRQRPPLGLPVCGPARRRPRVPRDVGAAPAGVGVGLAVSAPHLTYRQGRGAPHGARHLPHPWSSTRSWAAPWPGCSGSRWGCRHEPPPRRVRHDRRRPEALRGGGVGPAAGGRRRRRLAGPRGTRPGVRAATGGRRDGRPGSPSSSPTSTCSSSATGARG